MRRMRPYTVLTREACISNFHAVLTSAIWSPRFPRVSIGNGGLLSNVYFAADWICE
jgi:hypothetical protein